MPSNYTIKETGTKSINKITTGHEKSHVTVMLSALSDCTKLPPLIVFKGVKPPSSIPSGIIVRLQPESWVSSIMKTY